jgi:hypothetical protein
MSDDAVKRVPTVEVPVMFYRRWEGLRKRGEHGPSTRWEQPAWEHEKEIMEHWDPLSDLVRSMPPRAGAFSGWPNYVENFCSELVDAFEALTKSWGWEELDQPEPGRSAEVEERDRRFTEAIELELMGSAIAWVSGWKGRDFDEAAVRWAEKARERVITPTMTPEDAKARFLDALRRRRQAPRLGTVIPKLRTIGDDVEAGDRGKLEYGLINLRKALVKIEGMRKERLTPWEPGQGAGEATAEGAQKGSVSAVSERVNDPAPPIFVPDNEQGLGRRYTIKHSQAEILRTLGYKKGKFSGKVARFVAEGKIALNPLEGGMVELTVLDPARVLRQDLAAGSKYSRWPNATSRKDRLDRNICRYLTFSLPWIVGVRNVDCG